MTEEGKHQLIKTLSNGPRKRDNSTHQAKTKKKSINTNIKNTLICKIVQIKILFFS